MHINDNQNLLLNVECKLFEQKLPDIRVDIAQFQERCMKHNQQL